MNTPKTLMTIALCLGAVPTALPQQNNEELKQHVVAQAQEVNPEAYAFTRTTQSEAKWNSKTFKNVTVERFDPTKPAHARWTLASINGKQPSAAALRKYRKQARNRRVVPGYHRLANYFGAPAIASTDAEGRTVFRFDDLPKGSISILEKDLSAMARAEAVVTDAGGAPFVEQVRVTIPPRRTQLFFKIDGYETVFQYRIGPGGKPFLTTTTSDMSGSGLGLNGQLHTATTYSDYQIVRNSQ
jgi:hypothetical protein